MKSLTYALVAILTVCMIGASMTSHIYAENSDKVRENGQMQDDEKINDWKAMKKYNCDKMYKHGEKDKYGAFMILAKGVFITGITTLAIGIYIIWTHRKEDLKDASVEEYKDNSEKRDLKDENGADGDDSSDGVSGVDNSDKDDSEKNSIDEDNIEDKD